MEEKEAILPESGLGVIVKDESTLMITIIIITLETFTDGHSTISFSSYIGGRSFPSAGPPSGKIRFKANGRMGVKGGVAFLHE